jgi:hypothetical protein
MIAASVGLASTAQSSAEDGPATVPVDALSPAKHEQTPQLPTRVAEAIEQEAIDIARLDSSVDTSGVRKILAMEPLSIVQSQMIAPAGTGRGVYLHLVVPAGTTMAGPWVVPDTDAMLKAKGVEASEIAPLTHDQIDEILSTLRPEEVLSRTISDQRSFTQVDLYVDLDGRRVLNFNPTPIPPTPDPKFTKILPRGGGAPAPN